MEERNRVNRKRVAVEEHFSTPEHLDDLRAILERRYPVREVVDHERFIGSDASFLPALRGRTLFFFLALGHLL